MPRPEEQGGPEASPGDDAGTFHPEHAGTSHEHPEKRPSGVVLNLALSLLLIPMAVVTYNNLDSIIVFITDNVMMMLAIGFFGKLISKIVFALAFIPIGTLYKLVHALIPGDDCVTVPDPGGGELERCYLAPWVAAAIYSGLSSIIEATAFAFHRRFTTMNEKGEEASTIISKMRGKMQGAIDLQSDMPTWKKFVEVFCIQNALGVPDTGTMIYYACATDYPWGAFAAATMLSYATIGLVKQVAWIVALRSIATRLKAEGFDALGNVTRDLDSVTNMISHDRCIVNLGRFILGSVGVVGLVIIAAKVVMALKHCMRSNQEEEEEGQAANPMFGIKSQPRELAQAGKRKRLPTVPPSATSDQQIDAVVREAFETYDTDNSGTMCLDEAVHFIEKLGMDASHQYVQGVWSVYDEDQSGSLDMIEFARFFEVITIRSSKTRAQSTASIATSHHDKSVGRPYGDSV